MRAGYSAPLASTLVLVAFFAFQGFYMGVYGTLTDLLTDVLAGLALVSAGVTMFRYQRGLGTRSGKIWLSFTAGILLWFLGEVTYSYYYDVLGVSIPYPSSADIFYLAGYFPLFVGFYLYVTYFRPVLPRRSVFFVVAATLAAAAAVVFILFQPVLANSDPALTKILDLAYPISDLVLLSVAILGLALFFGGKLGSAWLFFNAGILLNVFADLLYSYMTAQSTYYSGGIPDLFFWEGYVVFALAFYHHRKDL